MRVFNIAVLAASLLLAYVNCSEISKDEEMLSRVRRQASFKRGRKTINVENIRSTSIQVGFDYIPGAIGYLITAREHEKSAVTQTIATSEVTVGQHSRQAVLRNLDPGREYLVEVTPLNSKRDYIRGSTAEAVIKTALRCYVCNGRASNGECKGRRAIRECPRGTDSCLNDLRFQNGRQTITKRCAQFRPEYFRPTRAGVSANAACKGIVKRDSFCQCACKSDLCNQEELPCDLRCFPQLRAPDNGFVQCNAGNKPGSQCTWTCKKGYRLEGRDKSSCRKEGTWSILTPPKCLKPTPPTLAPPSPGYECPQPPTVANGRFVCTDGNKEFSKCHYSCASNYVLEGSSPITCNNRGRWNGPFPTCSAILCPMIKSKQPLQSKCSQSNRVGSVCKFSCEGIYSLIGVDSLRCLGTRRWSDLLPKCELRGCHARPRIGSNVLSECEDLAEPEVGAVCRYSCRTGFKLRGATTVTCRNNKWDNGAPTCTRITCNPAMTHPASGVVRCSNRQSVGSVCVFVCNRGFSIVGQPRVTCQSSERWSSVPPKCKKISCKPIENSRFGSFSCNRANSLGSSCSFRCITGYGFPLRTRTRITCLGPNRFTSPDAKYPGRWSSRIPKCEKIRCPEIKLSKGLSRSCNRKDYRQVGSRCSFRCQAGYRVAGRSRLTCYGNRAGNSVGRWNAKVPVCVRMQCRKLGVVRNGKVNCTEDRYSGSKCTVQCDYGYKVNGNPSFDCLNDGRWSGRLPHCSRVECRAITSQQHRHVEFKCGRPQAIRFGVALYYVGFECPLGCRAGYKLNEESVAQCDRNGLWIIPSNTKCEDTNECLTSNGGCEQICTNTEGSYKCSCRKNYRLTRDGKNCRLTVCSELTQHDKQILKCNNGRRIGSKCEISCALGYEPRDGAASLSCRKDGSWNLKQAACLEVECSPLRSPVDGEITCTNENTYQSVCTSKCAVGYELVGEARSQCSHTKSWTSRVPRCRKIQCPEDELAIENGRAACTDANFYQSRCTFTCNSGYEYQDASNIVTRSTFIHTTQCLSDSSWSDPAPTCVKITCSPSWLDISEQFPNSEIICTDQNRFDSVCSITCNDGYQLQGSARTTCMSTRTWAHDLGRCQKVQCHAFESITNGNIRCTEGNYFQSSCTFTCDEGYNRIGASSALCQADQTWTARRPRCQIVQCDESQTFIVNGAATCTNEHFYDSVCTTTCNAGYEFNDETINNSKKNIALSGVFNLNSDEISFKCQASGQWDLNPPICVKHKCSPNISLMDQERPNGKLSCTDGENFLSVCNLECNEGYEINGASDTTRCTETRSWSKELGRCTRIQCEELIEFENGKRTCSNEFLFESICQYQCSAGYDLIGEKSLTCRADRTFTGTQPECQKIECRESFTVLENGNATCTDANKFQSQCVYTCDPGYEITGAKSTKVEDNTVTLTCMANRTWGGILPICSRKQCSNKDGALAKAALNGVVTCTEEDYFGSLCSVKCNVGYELVGSSSTRCTASADWEPVLGYCKKVECTALSAPVNGVMACTDENRYRSNCTFRCNIGYERIGVSFSVCQSSRIFTDAPPTCQEIVCPVSFTSLLNGKANCSNTNKFNSRCSYSCDAGYELSPGSVSSATCQVNYQWNAENPPRCTKSRCSLSDPVIRVALEHGTSKCTDENRFESICTLTCNDGYELEGEGTTTCLSNLMWQETFGYCQKIRCPAFDELDQGDQVCSDGNKYQSVCRFSCDSGYDLVGSEVSVCQANRKFSKPLPKCQKIRCSAAYLTMVNGTVECTDSNLFESVCEYTCAPGYEVTSGSTRTRCEDNRSWSREKAVCEKKICLVNDANLVKAERNGEVTCTEGSVYNSVCSVECDAGYELVGNEETRCNEDAEWDPVIGYCTKIHCPEFEDLQNGFTNCSDSNRFLSSCEFDCLPGFEMGGHPSTTCKADRAWTNPLPFCFKITCSSAYLSLDNGLVNCTDANRYQSNCTYVCSPGYETTNIRSAICTASEIWSSPKPTCLKKKCPADDENLLKAIETGTVTCSETNLFESVCTIKCPKGYELVNGNEQIRCLETAQWNEKIGFCQKIRCPALERPGHGEIICTDENQYLSKCSFSCVPGYYLDGEEDSICLANRTFSSGSPMCKRISCPADHLSISFGKTSCTDGRLFESVCTYLCDSGYQFLESDFIVQESESSMCRSDATWSTDVPICEKKTCPVLNNDDFLAALNMDSAEGKLVCSEGNRYGSVCSLDCSTGYEVEGNSVISCTDDGKWNDTIGKCTIIECEVRAAPSDGTIQCSDEFNFATECEFTCDEGYEFVETNKVLRDTPMPLSTSIRSLCTPQKGHDRPSWTVNEIPVCGKIRCPREGWDKIENGNVSCTDENRYESECLYECHRGYKLVNPNDETSVFVMCLSNKTWSVGEVPHCKRVQCSPDAAESQQSEEHGTITCTDGSNFQSLCTVVCNRGYELNTQFSGKECLSTGEWSHELGSCEEIECPKLEVPANSKITCTDEYFFKSHCRVHCNPGYEIVDPEEEYDIEKGLSCRSDRSWCGEFPKCAKITCSEDHLQLERGTVNCTDENMFESVCKYTCHAGYHMIQGQSSTSSCTSDASWSSTVPVCESNRCPANDSSFTSAEVEGTVTCTDENKYGSTCMIKCSDGYRITGESETKCRSDSTWNNGLGRCTKIICNDYPIPLNARLECTDQQRFGSACKIICLSGYKRMMELEGNHVFDIQCAADRKWIGSPQQCEKIKCPAEGFEIVENGQVQCSDRNVFQSECLFSCDPGFKLVDRLDNDVHDPSVRCTTSGSWSMSEAPKCIPSECSPTAEAIGESIANGELSCTSSSEFGSKCTLICDPGYETIGEYEFTECDSNNQWWPVIEGCKKIQCKPLNLPANALVMECNDESNFDSTCSVSRCQPGYEILAPEDNLRTCTKFGYWSGSEAECVRLRCPEAHLGLENGHVVCTNQNRFESRCDYYCDPSYEMLSKAESSTCQASGEWSSKAPICVPRRTCSSTYFSLGIVNCNSMSICKLICDPGTQKVGPYMSMCMRSGMGTIRWSPPLGACRKKSCPSLPAIENGQTTCSSDFLFRSQCSFRCNKGFRLSGAAATQCRADMEWSEPLPTCKVVTCDKSYLELEHGSVLGSRSNNVGSDLAYQCIDEGFELIGSSEVTCLNNGMWSKDKPMCRLGRCPPLRLLNGRLECDRSVYNEYGSKCKYVCNDLYQIQGRSETTECGFDGQWTNPRPYCRGHCDINFANFQNGFADCTDSNWHHSQCSFRCGLSSSFDQVFQLYGSKEVTCMESGRWSESPPCCAKPCPPSGKVDLFFALDSSDSVGYKNWTKMLSFINQIVSTFIIGQNDLLVGVMRYNRDVDVRDEIKLGQYNTSTLLRNAITFLPYGGFGTNTGRALDYLIDHSLSAEANRPDAKDYVIVITDGPSQDNVDGPSKRLRTTNATVYTIGIGGSKTNLDQLEKIASSPEDVFAVEDGFNGLTASLVEQITNSMCKNPCLLNEDYSEEASYYIKQTQS